MVSTVPILVLQHIACEPPAAYEDELRARGLPIDRVQLDEGQELPSWRGYAGIVAMGGPMGTYEEAGHPWLADEKRLIAEAVLAGMPYWGVCLGAQLLAASLGAEVARGPRPEVGVASVQLTAAAAADPVFCAAPATFEALHWHGDTFTLPDGAVRLARSAQYEQQAFAIGHAYGLQFHLEVPVALAREWLAVPSYADSLEHAMGADASARLLAQLERASCDAIALARRLFARWLDEVVGPHGSGASSGTGGISGRAA